MRWKAPPVRDELLFYYERELGYLRRLGAEFGKRYPKIASRLLLEPSKCDDPHVERLLEGVAFLAARVHLKLEDDFPEISESLLNVVFPHYVRPIPSLSIAEFQLDPDQGKLTTGYHLPKGTLLYSREVGGVPCKFQTCYDTAVWPLEVAEAAWVAPDAVVPAIRVPDTVGVIRLKLRCLPDVEFSKLELKTLRFHLAGESNLVGTLYELLANNCTRVVIRSGAGARKREVSLAGTALRPVGFGEDEGVLPFSRRSFLGHRLLLEYFVFPEKFHFFDIDGFDQLAQAGAGSDAEVLCFMSPFERADRRQALESAVAASTFRLGCTPIVNLFSQVSEPLLLTGRQLEYQVVPDARRRLTTEVYSVDDVTAVLPNARDPVPLRPLYSFQHERETDGPGALWYAKRRSTGWRSDEGTDVYLSFVNLDAESVHPEADAVTARLTCFNSDLPSRLPFNNPEGDFQLPEGGPMKRILALVKPTSVIQPPLGKPQLWRLVSLLSLNYLSLVDDGPAALQEILRLHNLGESATGEKHVQGLVGVESKPAYARVESEHGLHFARGRQVSLTFDEERFAGGGVFLLASVLDRFLAQYATLNSFTRCEVRTVQRHEPVRTWTARAGRKALL
ncbi:MAG: type VI secretion system baseplate subunit TssF [Gemmatimonadales bacterium]